MGGSFSPMKQLLVGAVAGAQISRRIGRSLPALEPWAGSLNTTFFFFIIRVGGVCRCSVFCLMFSESCLCRVEILAHSALHISPSLVLDAHSILQIF